MAAPLKTLIFKPSVMKRAGIMAGIVGCLIAAINHGDTIVMGRMQVGDWARVAVTFFVPYTVSTISSVLALREQHRLLNALQIPNTPRPTGDVA